MDELFAIAKSTLTAIADMIRGMVGGDETTPEDMPDKIALIYDIGYSEGYDEGYGEGYYDGYSNGYYVGYDEGYDVGYETAQDDFPRAEGTTSFLSQDYLINGDVLTDIQDAIRENAPNSLDEGYEMTPEDMPSLIGFCYIDGYDDGYYVGYDVGYTDAREIAYAEDKVPLIIQGLNTTNGLGLYYPQIFNTSLCGKSYNETDFFGYDVVTSSSAFNIAVTNSSRLELYMEVHAWCQYTNEENNWAEEFFFLELTLAPGSDGSASCNTTAPGSSHDWKYEIQGMEFS